MSYVDRVLQPGERVVVRATLHRVTYLPGLVFLAGGVLAFILMDQAHGLDWVFYVVGLLLTAVGLVMVLRSWFLRWGTEIAVTDRRVIYKTGVISRRTVEMNMDQVESVKVDQTILGRMLDYGDIGVHGTGEGIESIRRIATPLTLRSAITAR